MRRLLVLFCLLSLSTPAVARERVRDAPPASIFDLLFPKQREPAPPEPSVRKRAVKPAERRKGAARITPPRPVPMLVFGTDVLSAEDIRSATQVLRTCAEEAVSDKATFTCTVRVRDWVAEYDITHDCVALDLCVEIAIMQKWCRSRGGTWKIGEAAFSCEA